MARNERCKRNKKMNLYKNDSTWIDPSVRGNSDIVDSQLLLISYVINKTKQPNTEDTVPDQRGIIHFASTQKKISTKRSELLVEIGR